MNPIAKGMLVFALWLMAGMLFTGIVTLALGVWIDRTQSGQSPADTVAAAPPR
jgi:hypothetical protein